MLRAKFRVQGAHHTQLAVSEVNLASDGATTSRDATQENLGAGVRLAAVQRKAKGGALGRGGLPERTGSLWE